MGSTYYNHNPNFYNEEVPEIEVEIEDEQEVRAAEENSFFCECALGFEDKPEYQSLFNQQGDTNVAVNLINLGGAVAFSSQGSHQSPKQLQLEGWETSIARVLQPQSQPQLQSQPRRTRPRIRRGLTPWQLSKLESVFQEAQYPDVITKKNLAKCLYLGESEVHRWFKIRRAKYRKNQCLHTFSCTPDGTQSTFP